MELLTGWAGVILGFSGLIFVHELGHFLVAKWNGVNVQVFSIGMGPYIVSFSHGGTVYALSLIPLGGYVKMMGQDDMNADLGENKNPADFRNKKPGQRAAILVAGAGFNIVLTLMIFTLCYTLGTWFPGPKIGNIVPNKPLAKAVIYKQDEKGEMKTPANLKRGDTILEVNGMHVKSGMDIMMFAATTPRGEPLTLRVERQELDGNSKRIEYVRVVSEDDKKMAAPSIGLDPTYWEEVPLALGFMAEWYFYIAEDLATDKDLKTGAAAKSGKFKKFDRLLAVENRNVQPPVVTKLDEPWTLTNYSAGMDGKERVMIVERDGKREELAFTPLKEEASGDYKFGLRQSLMKRVTAIEESSEAYKAGLRIGDFVKGFEPDNIRVRPWTSGKLTWFKKLDDAKPQTAMLSVPEFEANRQRGVFYQSLAYSEMYRTAGLGEAAGVALDDTKNYTLAMFSTIRGLFTGSIGVKNLSGPVGIGKTIYMASTGQTFLGYLWWLGFISLNLGVMQLLPIPLLDGFHLVLVFLEKIKGSPVSAKIQVACFYVGMVLIGLLFSFVMWNDFTR